MDVTTGLGLFIFGAILGSFLNALSFRFNTGKSMGGRSACMRCGHRLGWYDLVPIVSFLYLRGACRYCHSRISPQYPIVEVLAGALSVLVYVQNPEPLSYGLFLSVWLTIVFIGVYDMRHTIIPWSCSLLLMALTFLSLFLPGISLWAFLAGPLLAAPLFLLSLVSRGTWMGWGDSAFELSLGWLLGVTMGLTALMLAVWSGALVGLMLIVLAKVTPTLRAGRWPHGFTIKSEIPFAPFLALGAALVYFFHVDFFSTLPLLF